MDGSRYGSSDPANTFPAGQDSRVMITGRWVMITGQWVMITGQWVMITGQWVMITE